MDSNSLKHNMSNSVNVKIDEFKILTLQNLLIDVIGTWFLSVLFIFSRFGIFLSFILILEACILGIWYIKIVRKVAKSYNSQKIITVNIDKIIKYKKIAWYIFGGFLCAYYVYIIFTFKSLSFTSLYDSWSSLNSILWPVLLISLPLMFNITILSAKQSSKNIKFSKYKSLIIVIMAVCSFVFSYTMLFYISPSVWKTSESYYIQQLNVNTHDIESLIKYKTDSYIDKDIVNNILKQLPSYNDFKDLNCENDSISVSYVLSSTSLDSKRICIYNVTALFALIDNLNNIDIYIDGQLYSFERSNVVDFYDDFTNILKEYQWNKEVRNVLSDDYYVEKTFDIMVK